jgi:hypothetical protein
MGAKIANFDHSGFCKVLRKNMNQNRRFFTVFGFVSSVIYRVLRGSMQGAEELSCI